MLVGVTGTIGSGKGEFCKILVSEGFTKLAFGDVVRKEAVRRGIVESRENLQLLGFRLRQEDGVDVWSKRVAERIEQGKNYVVDGFRYPDQVNYFRERFGFDVGEFQLVAIESLDDNRFDRLRKRGREGDPRTWEEFWIQDRRDWVGYLEGTGQDVRGCFGVADYKVFNNGTLDNFAIDAKGFLMPLRLKC